MQVRTLLLLTSLPFAVACVAAPVRMSPDLQIDTPENYSAARPGAVEPEPLEAADWWTTFGDPDLNGLVDTALNHNRDLQAAAARLEQAEALARIAGADLKPRVGVDLSAGRSKRFIGLGIPGLSFSTTTNVGVSVNNSWEPDLWGRLRAQAKAGLADLQATDADYRAARLSIAGRTARAWFAVAEATEQVELARRSAESFSKLAGQIRGRYELGVRPAIDLRLALSNEAAASAQLQQRSRQLDQATRLLEILLGRYPAASLLAEHPPRELTPPPAPVPTGLPSELVARRPDLVAAERRLAATDQRLFVARRQLYPRFSLTAGGGTGSDQLSDLLDGDFRVWSWLANLTQPLFQGGRLRAGVDQARAAVDESAARYANAVLLAYAEVETALAAETYLERQEHHLAETASQLIAAERLAEERYRSGIGGYLAVLESQTRSFSAQSNLITLRRARLDNRVDLHLSLGGGFDAASDMSPAGPVETRKPQQPHQEEAL